MAHENLIKYAGDGSTDFRTITDDKFKKYHFSVSKNGTARIQHLGLNGYTGLITISGYVYCDAGTCGLHFDVCDKDANFVIYNGKVVKQSDIIVDTTKRYFVATCNSPNQYNTPDNYNGFVDHDISLGNGCSTIFFEKVKIEKGSWTDYTY